MGERATDAELLGKLFEKYTDRPVVVIESVQKALEYVLEHQEKKRTVYCLGSLYLTGMVKETIERMRKEKRRKPEEKKLKGSRKSRSWKQQQTERAADMWGGYRQMLNYEEEIRKFKPSLEVEDIEDAVYEEDLTDMQDLLKEVMEKKKKEEIENGGYKWIMLRRSCTSPTTGIMMV